MEHAFNLLDNQPDGWPKWQLARDGKGKLLKIKHMFIFEPTGVSVFGLHGNAVSACGFVNGAEWVERAPDRDQMLSDPADPMCLDCMEVSLQHGLDRA